MAQKYLTNDSSIDCTAGSTSSTIRVTGSSVMIEGEMVVCATDKTFAPFGTCKILTAMAQGVSTPCNFISTGIWQQTKSDVSSTSDLVLGNSKLMCSWSGIITPKNFPNKTVITGATSSAQSSSSGSSSVDSIESSTTQAENAINPQNSSINNSEKRNSKEDETQEECYWDTQDLEFENDAGVLRENMRQFNPNYTKEAKCLEEKYKVLTGLTYSVDSGIHAAHHLISGNQIFGKFPTIIKKSLASGYDVNNYQNGILLPTLSQQIKNKLKFTDRKIPVAFEVMQKTKRQWHVGGHSYKIDFDKDENTAGLKDYVTSVSELMVNLELSWENLECKQRTDAQDKKIQNDLNSLSLKIAKHINKFATNPKNSKPFYVSKVAMMYAFGIAESIKFIAYQIVDDKIIVHYYKYKKKKELLLLLKETELEEDDHGLFIRFVTNATTFVTYNNSRCRDYKPFKELEDAIYIDKYPNETLHDSIKRRVLDIVAKSKQASYLSRDIIRARLEQI